MHIGASDAVPVIFSSSSAEECTSPAAIAWAALTTSEVAGRAMASLVGADCASGEQCLMTACIPDLGIPGLGGGTGTLPGGISLCTGGTACPAGKKCQFGLVCL